MLLIAVASLCFPSLTMQSGAQDGRISNKIHFSVKPLGSGVRLSQTQVSAFSQDPEGRLWVATQHGLDRYDGVRVKTFLHSSGDRRTVGCSSPESIWRSREGQLWIPCGPVLDRYEPETESFTHFPLGTDRTAGTIHAVAQQSDGSLLFGLLDGLYHLDKRSGALTHVPRHATDPLIDKAPVLDLERDGSGQWWMLTPDALIAFDEDTFQAQRRISLRVHVTRGSIHHDRRGTLWLIANSRLYQTRQSDDDTLREITTISGGPHSMLEDQQGDMWFSTENAGVYYLPQGNGPAQRFLVSCPANCSLPSDRVSTLFEDRNGDIWVGFHDASPVLIQRDPSGTQIFSFRPNQQDGLRSPLATSLYSMSDRLLLVGTSGGLQLLDLPDQHFTDAFKELRPKDVFSVIRDRRQDLWFATDKGVAIQGSSHSAISWIVPDRDVHRLLPLDNSQVLALASDGLVLIEQDTHRHLDVLRAAPGERFYSIALSPEKIWLGTSLGLRFIPRTALAPKLLPLSQTMLIPTNAFVLSILPTDTDTVWLGTQSGLVHYFKGRLAPVSEPSHLGGQIIACIMKDSKSNLWMSSNQGLLSYNPAKKLMVEHTAGMLPVPLDLSGWGACTQSANGQMYFGGFGGVVSFTPESLLATSTSAHHILLTGLMVNSARVEVGTNHLLQQPLSTVRLLTLNRKQNTFTVEFSSVDLDHSDTSLYRARLRGLESNWKILPRDEASISYSQVPAGNYILEFQSSADGILWSDAGGTLPIVVRPAWWASGWFIALYIAAIALAARLAFVMRLRRSNALLQATMDGRMRERTSLARELHDTLLQDFQGVILRCSSLALQLEPGDARRAALERTIQHAERSLNEGKDAIQQLRTNVTSVSELKPAFEELAGDLAVFTAAIISVHEDCSAGCSLDVSHVQEVYTIGREALRNAVQHAHASQIVVTITADLKRLSLVVSDNGVGMPEASTRTARSRGHWGLKGMMERAGKIDASVEIVSEQGNGTTLRLTVPTQTDTTKSIRNRFGLLP